MAPFLLVCASVVGQIVSRVESVVITHHQIFLLFRLMNLHCYLVCCKQNFQFYLYCIIKLVIKPKTQSSNQKIAANHVYLVVWKIMFVSIIQLG